ncbi:class I SAM-dependent methyltransferase [Fontivita pretiosa]|uniref:class I SAM-dependent methyltransferase n=1 Tax=Fontivita pretiosa TaxID=2989684 RepID=UPI003D177DD3
MSVSTLTTSVPKSAQAGTDGLYVQYGCGLSSPEGWLNFDASPTLRTQRVPVLRTLVGGKLGPIFPPSARYGDIRKGLPVADQSCAGVYCSHVLEHLALSDFRVALRNTLRILKPGGIFRLVMPDLHVLASEYLARYGDPDASMKFMKDSCFGQENRPRGFIGYLREWIGNAQHRWLWDFPSLERELRQAGFADIRRAQFGDSSDPHFAAVEDRNRWDRGLGAECVRPVRR